MSHTLYKNEEQPSLLSGDTMSPTSVAEVSACYENALHSYDSMNLPDAIANLERVVSRDPCYKDAMERLGYYQQELEGIQANEIILRRQLHKNPDNAETCFNLADTLFVLGKTEEAASLWQRLDVQNADHWGRRARKMLERVASTTR